MNFPSSSPHTQLSAAPLVAEAVSFNRGVERKPFTVPDRFHRLTAYELRGEYGRYLERGPWLHFGTLTTKRPCSEERADEVWRQFVRETWRRQGQHHRFHYVRVKEPFETRPGVHIHFLSFGTERFLDESERNSLSAWSQEHIGRLQLLAYDKRRGARDYICKYVTCYGGSKFDIRFSPQARSFFGPPVPEPEPEAERVTTAAEAIARLQSDKRSRLPAWLERVEAERRAGFITWRETPGGFVRVTTPNPPEATTAQPEASYNPN